MVSFETVEGFRNFRRDAIGLTQFLNQTNVKIS